MKQFWIIFLLNIFYVKLQQVSCFSAGVPPLPTVCKNLTPQHGNYTPQISDAPYEILVEPNSVSAGNTVTVTLKSTSDKKFKGFYVQGRGEAGTPIGTFRTNTLTEAHSCGGIRWNGAHHSSGKIEKDLVMITWEAPKNYEGEIIFIGSFVQNYVTIWTGVYAESITVTMRNETQGVRGRSGGIFQRPPGQIKSSLLKSASTFLNRIFQPTKLLRLFSNNSTIRLLNINN